jgi:hypothetical protein
MGCLRKKEAGGDDGAAKSVRLARFVREESGTPGGVQARILIEVARVRVSVGPGVDAATLRAVIRVLNEAEAEFVR